MKTTLIVLGIAVALILWWSVSLAKDKREAERLPDLLPGTTWKYTQEHFDKALERYTIRIETPNRPNDRELKEIAEYTKRTHTEGPNFIIFFDEPGRMGAYLKVSYASIGSGQAHEGSFEKLENFER